MEKLLPIKMRTKDIHWDERDDRIAAILSEDVDVTTLPQSEIHYLIKELDRRLVQLWDKRMYDRPFEDARRLEQS